MKETGGEASAEQRTPPARPKGPPLWLVLSGFIAAAAAALPAIYLVVRALEAPLSRIWAVITHGSTLGLLRNTLLLTAAVTASALLVGVLTAWLTVRTDLPLRQAWATVNALPLVIPSYLGGYAYVAALGPRGMVQGWLEPLGVERLPEIYGFGGAWLVLSVFTYPYVFLSVRGALLRVDPSLEEAAATLGERPARVFFRVILPQIWPAIASGGLLVGLYTLHDFGAVSLLRYDSFSRAIYLSYEGSLDRTGAAILSLVLVAITVAVVAAEIRLRPKSSIYRVHGAGGREAHPAPLRKLRWPLFAVLCFLAGLALVVPLTVVGYWFWQGLGTNQAMGATLTAAGNSLSASAMGAVLALAAAWPLSALAARFPGRMSRTLEKAGFVAYALPGIVVALSLVFFGVRFAPWLYQSRWMLAAAYMILFLPLAAGAIKTSFVQLSPRLDEAARTLGAGRLVRFRLVSMPAMRPGLIAAISLVLLSAMKELPATLLLAPIEFPTLATRVWGATHAASFAGAAAPALALVLLSSAPLGYLLSRDEDRALRPDPGLPIGSRDPGWVR